MKLKFGNTSVFRPVVAGVLFFSFLFSTACSKSGNGGGGSGGGNPPITEKAQLVVSASDKKQIIQGFGCATVFNPPNTSAITSTEFDRLFGTANGQLGLTILRIRVASDASWRAVELAYAREASQRGARILASPWSPPANMKSNNNLIGGSLIPDSSASYARYLNGFADYMAANSVPLYAISVQNEPDISVTYESCDWTATAMRDFIKNHGQLITSTRLMAPESFNNNQSYVNTILSDDGALANLDLVGGHIYGGGLAENPLATAKGKEVWMTEHLDTATSYTANMNTAIEIHNCLTSGNFSAYIWWYGKRFYGMIGQDGLVTKRGYITSQFSRFVRPGAIRLGTTTNSLSDVWVSAFLDGTKKIFVVINNRSTQVEQEITVQNGTLGDLLPYTTSFTKDVEAGARITSSSGAFKFTLAPNSVTSFVEQ